MAQRKDLAGQRDRIVRLGIAGAIGGVIGASLLLASGDAVFRKLVPFLLLFACAVLGFQNQIKQRFVRSGSATTGVSVAAVVAVGVASVYGGYFGAGLGILLLAVLGVTLTDSLPRLNALKQLISTVINVCAAIFFLFRAPVQWSLVAVMAPLSLIGGAAGGRVAGRLKPARLRILVLAIGVTVAIIELIRRVF
jgi:uncharacterized membrane protein YfcA